MRSVEVLAQIRLNATSAEQFASIACGLADDEPAIRAQVYQAACDARHAASLIAHLRNLFVRQTQLDERTNHHNQYVGLKSKPSQQQQDERAQQRQQESELSTSTQLFTYSNQLQLVRAAKCLVANVAKILYLIDSGCVRPQLDSSSVGTANKVS